MGFGKASRRRRQHQKDIPLIYARHIFCCLRRATFDWPKVAKGQSRRGISISPSLTNLPLKRPTGGLRPPYRVTPRGSPTVASVSTGGLRCHAAGAGGADAPPQQWDLWPNSKAFSPDKTVPPSIQGRHALTPCLVHKPGGGKIGPRRFSVPPTQAVTAGAGPHRERKDVSRRIFSLNTSVEP